MSLAIDIRGVSRVLLADGWHDVADSSFDLDAYEFVWSGSGRYGHVDGRDPILIHGDGRHGVCATGFSFRTPDGGRLAGPLTAILAVTYQGSTHHAHTRGVPSTPV